MDTLFDLPPAVPRPPRTRARATPAPPPPPTLPLWTRPPAPPTPGPVTRSNPGLSPMPAPEEVTGSLAALLGFTHDHDAGSQGISLCLWAAVETALLTEGYQLHTPEYLAELHRRMAAIQHCDQCPGAATCRSWQLRKATLAVRQELLRQGRDPAQAWPLRWVVIRAQFRRFRVPLPLFVHPDTSDIQAALEAGETLTVNDLTFSPWPDAPVFLVTPGG